MLGNVSRALRSATDQRLPGAWFSRSRDRVLPLARATRPGVASVPTLDGGAPLFARVTTFPGLAPERIKATLQEFEDKHLPRFEQQPGYRGVWAGVDYTGGRAIATTYWESIEALHASYELANESRPAAVTSAGVSRNPPLCADLYE